MIYFLSENFIKTYVVIPSNVDVKTFTPLIQSSCYAYIKPMIGTYFFNDLLEKYNNQTLSSDELILVEKIQFAVLWRLCAKAGITATYQFTNKGYQKQFDDNSTSVELNEVTFMYDTYIQEALIFQNELKQFLIDNKDDYPNFLDKLNKDSSVRSLCGCNNSGDWNEGVGFIVI